MFKLKKYEKIVQKVYQVLPKYKRMVDIELQSQTNVFRSLLANGQNLEKILPDIFAVIMEADRRVLGLEPFKVQVLGGLALFFGNIAEMKTGEGKTLVATLPLYARALQGNKGNFLITSNEYLAERDGESMGKVFKWLGLTVGIGVNVDDDKKIELYDSDIIYTTHSSLGFDYLFDNLGSDLDQQAVKRFNFAIIDEIDAVLLDGAQTSLIISGAPKVQSSLFEISNWFVNSLDEEDYELSEDRKKVWFSPLGIKKFQEYFNTPETVFSARNFDIYRHIVLALQANMLKKRDQDYVVDDGKVVLLDEVNGRKMNGVKLNGGIHQAIEAKESLKITPESKTLGMVSYQSLFKKFKSLSGMTGTAKTDEKEFIDTYHLEVIEIPTNLPLIRIDKKDQIYLTNQAKIEKSLELVKKGINEKRPILIETGSVSMSQLYSLILLQNRIPHNLLNASTAPQEKQIISEVGGVNSITLATSMAGRGTDIKLTPEAKENGGLLVIGTERMTSKRIDNQLRGRAGRQGEPGESQFLVSLEDKIVVENTSNRVRKYHDINVEKGEIGEFDLYQPIDKRIVKHAIDSAQRKVGNLEAQGRERTMAFDTILSNQREKIYRTRNEVLTDDPDFIDELINSCLNEVITNFVDNYRSIELHDVADFIFNNVESAYELADIEDQLAGNMKKKNIHLFLFNVASEALDKSLDRFKNGLQLAYFKKITVLKAIDNGWIDQLDYLQQLKSIVDGRSSAQHKPINEFALEARRSFFNMEKEMWLNMFRNLLLTEIEKNIDGSIELSFP
ncbi:preprotein translocase subunit SecA [Weissella koreensis KACC 15510]|uniref:preprotein translocase subunit SecA n=1 Tax=Weissella koreensis TaxID=165096 RepID=UPI0002175877|nr:preprotein translocase subunit SecA [Weissella koreensis]AEJ22920.1 preprotein translocase subunit SecA [Weissella koreensis KACC 15510]